MKRKVSLLFVMLCLCLLFCSTVQAASPKLNKDKIVLLKGDTKKLTLKNVSGNVIWKSSDKTVAKVSENGKVTAVRAGKCEIRAKYKKKTYTCNVTVYASKMHYRITKLKQSNTISKNQNKIVLAGSSSITRWVDAAAHFKPYKVVNLGISGSKVEDWQTYYSTIVKYNPKVIVWYLGGNNITNNTPGLGNKTSQKLVKLMNSVRKQLPDTKIYFVSIHPNKKRWAGWNETKICNKVMREYCKKTRNFEYIDITGACLKNGVPNKALLDSDGLHFNKNGYTKIWYNIVAKTVKQDMKKK